MGENAPKFREYQLPYGENYREILLTLPNQWEKPRAAQIANEARIKELRQEMYGTSGTDEIRKEISRLHSENTALQKQISDAPIYRSSHFNQPNILAHMRVNDRIDADGKKMLFIEEVQSDWHQAGREQGYAKKQTKLPNNLEVIEWDYANSPDTKYVVVNKETGLHTGSAGSTKEEAIKTWGAKQAKSGVPDAPFKDTWYQLALKRALKYAADNGYERVGLTTGKQQAMRYPDEGNVKGMEKYYDEVYPNFLDKYGKKFGSQVGQTRIKTGRGVAGGEPVHYLDITSEMKESTSKGQPLFAATPLLPATSLLDEEKRKEITSLLE
jgi:hypothetical protein